MFRIDFSNMYKYVDDTKAKLEKLRTIGSEEMARRAAIVFLEEVIKRTPVGEYDPNGTVKFVAWGSVQVEFIAKTEALRATRAGALRRGWTSFTEEEAFEGTDVSPEEFVASLPVETIGDLKFIRLRNPVSYFKWVDLGHESKTPTGRCVRDIKGSYMVERAQEATKGRLGSRYYRIIDEIVKGIHDESK